MRIYMFAVLVMLGACSGAKQLADTVTKALPSINETSGPTGTQSDLIPEETRAFISFGAYPDAQVVVLYADRENKLRTSAQKTLNATCAGPANPRNCIVLMPKAFVSEETGVDARTVFYQWAIEYSPNEPAISGPVRSFSVPSVTLQGLGSSAPSCPISAADGLTLGGGGCGPNRVCQNVGGGGASSPRCMNPI